MEQNTLQSIISELEIEIQKLVRKNNALKKENADLRLKAEQAPAQSDLFGALSTNERITMKAKVEHLLTKVEQHLQRSEQV